MAKKTSKAAVKAAAFQPLEMTVERIDDLERWNDERLFAALAAHLEGARVDASNFASRIAKIAEDPRAVANEIRWQTEAIIKATAAAEVASRVLGFWWNGATVADLYEEAITSLASAAEFDAMPRSSNPMANLDAQAKIAAWGSVVKEMSRHHQRAFELRKERAAITACGA